MLLWLLWALILMLIAVVMALLAGLALGRLVSTVLERRRAARRQALMTRVLAHLDQPEGSEIAGAAPGPHLAADFASVLREVAGLVRGGSRARLIALARDLGMVEHLLVRLGHWQAGVRAAAARDLHLFDEPRILGELRARLVDQSYEVRLAAARSLVQMGAVEEVAALIPPLAGHEGRAPPRRLGRLFFELARSHGTQVVDVVRSDMPAAVRELALEALVAAPDIGPIVAIRAVAGDVEPTVRAAGFRTLARLGHPAARHAIERGLRDPVAEVRIEALRCAARLGLEALVPGMRRLLEDDVWRVRKASVDALGRLGEVGRAALREALQGQTRSADLAPIAV